MENFTRNRDRSSTLRMTALAALFGCLCLATLLPYAGALPDYLAVAKKTYGIKPKSTLDKASCKLCHTSGGPPDLNPYGSSIKLALKQKKTGTLTPAILHALDDKDADGDGFNNALELKADTLPGDAKSHPDGPPPTAPRPDGPATSDKKATFFDISTALFARSKARDARGICLKPWAPLSATGATSLRGVRTVCTDIGYCARLPAHVGPHRLSHAESPSRAPAWDDRA